MTGGFGPITFLLDAGVPVSVGKTLRVAGHVVFDYRDVLQDGVPDVVVALTALYHGAVLIACDADMRRLVRRFGVTHDRFRRLDLVALVCPEVQAAHRAREALSLIEHEWLVSRTKVARRLWVDIGAHYIRTNR